MKKRLSNTFRRWTDVKSDKVEEIRTSVADKNNNKKNNSFFSYIRLFGYAYKESLELLRDPVRLTFALLGTVFFNVHYRLRNHPGCGRPEIFGT